MKVTATNLLKSAQETSQVTELIAIPESGDSDAVLKQMPSQITEIIQISNSEESVPQLQLQPSQVSELVRLPASSDLSDQDEDTYSVE